MNMDYRLVTYWVENVISELNSNFISLYTVHA
jgi:hypothetical protein